MPNALTLEGIRTFRRQLNAFFDALEQAAGTRESKLAETIEALKKELDTLKATGAPVFAEQSNGHTKKVATSPPSPAKPTPRKGTKKQVKKTSKPAKATREAKPGGKGLDPSLVLEVLRKAPKEGYRVQEIADLLKEDGERVRFALRKLRDDGKKARMTGKMSGARWHVGK